MAAQARALTLLLFLVMSVQDARALLGTSYESQIGGDVAATLQFLIIVEFAGQRPLNVVAPGRPACTPADHNDLRAAANNKAALEAIQLRCKLVEITVDGTQIHMIATPPKSNCAALMGAFNGYMAPSELHLKYKGFQTTMFPLARGLNLMAVCHEDGSLRVSAPRKSESRR